MKRRKFIKMKRLGLTLLILAIPVLSMAKENKPVKDGNLDLNFHLMHPGGLSDPGDPNAAFFLNGTCHLHYIIKHPWKKGNSYSFIHVSSRDMLHWEWHKTKLQPSFTGMVCLAELDL